MQVPPPVSTVFDGPTVVKLSKSSLKEQTSDKMSVWLTIKSPILRCHALTTLAFVDSICNSSGCWVGSRKSSVLEIGTVLGDSSRVGSECTTNSKSWSLICYHFICKFSFICYPAAQFPLAVPPLLVHSSVVKQVPVRLPDVVLSIIAELIYRMRLKPIHFTLMSWCKGHFEMSQRWTGMQLKYNSHFKYIH